MKQIKQIATLALLQMLSNQCNAVDLASDELTEEVSDGPLIYRVDGTVTGLMI